LGWGAGETERRRDEETKCGEGGWGEGWGAGAEFTGWWGGFGGWEGARGVRGAGGAGRGGGAAGARGCGRDLGG